MSKPPKPKPKPKGIAIGDAHDAKTGPDGKTRLVFNEARARAKKPAGQRGKSTKRKYSGISVNVPILK